MINFVFPIFTDTEVHWWEAFCPCAKTPKESAEAWLSAQIGLWGKALFVVFTLFSVVFITLFSVVVLRGLSGVKNHLIAVFQG